LRFYFGESVGDVFFKLSEHVAQLMQNNWADDKIDLRWCE
jgi:hypothetical protein